MRKSIYRTAGSAGALMVAAGLLATSAGAAMAASSTPWEPDGTNEVGGNGTLAFYNAAGTQITSGTDLTHLFQFAAASSADPTGGSEGVIEFAKPALGTDPNNPTSGTANPGTWGTSSATSASAFPVATPASVAAITTPVATVNSTDANGNLQSFINSTGGLVTTGSLAGICQVRLLTTDAFGDGTANNGGTYWAGDIQVNAAGTSWTEIYGSTLTTSVTTPTSNDPTATEGDSITFSATETGSDGTHPAGTIQFEDAAGNIGSAQTVDASGAASVTTTALTHVGSPYSVTAVFSPTGTTYSGSTSSALTQTVGAAATHTVTTLGISGDTTTGTDATLSGTVTPTAGGNGTVEFFDGGSGAPNTGGTPLAISGGPTATVTGGDYSATLTGGFAAGPHHVVAVFTPSDSTYAKSTSNEVDFNTIQGAAAGSTCSQTGSQCSDTQTIEGEIPTGTLVISTPYTDTSPLDIGKLALDSTGSYWTGSAAFKCITITDASSGGSPFVASALANTLTQVPGSGNPAQNTSGAATSINSENVGLTNLALSAAPIVCPDGSTPTQSYTGTRTVSSNPAANGVPLADTGSAGLGGSTPHQIVSGQAGGEGTVAYDGTITLNAPTSTAAGTYKGTIVFTVTD